MWEMQKAERTIEYKSLRTGGLGESDGLGFSHVGRPWGLVTEQLIKRKVFWVCV